MDYPVIIISRLYLALHVSPLLPTSSCIPISASLFSFHPPTRLANADRLHLGVRNLFFYLLGNRKLPVWFPLNAASVRFQISQFPMGTPHRAICPSQLGGLMGHLRLGVLVVWTAFTMQ